ncbi:MAG: hypothetical protein GX326_01210 [Clostridiaceae bacterium]|nr:hypothetical protein [Clostridiaceae bacterium]
MGELTVRELKRNARLQQWYQDIKVRLSQGVTIEDWCGHLGISVATYYYRQQQVNQALEKRLAEEASSVEFGSLPEPKAIPEETSATKARLSSSIMIKKSDLQVEIPDGISRETILSLLEGLKC